MLKILNRGSKLRPIVVRVRTQDRAMYVAEKCTEYGWHYLVGIEPDKPEDISDLEKLLSPIEPIIKSAKIERNASCPCGSGKKYKKCCDSNSTFAA